MYINAFMVEVDICVKERNENKVQIYPFRISEKPTCRHIFRNYCGFTRHLWSRNKGIVSQSWDS